MGSAHFHPLITGSSLETGGVRSRSAISGKMCISCCANKHCHTACMQSRCANKLCNTAYMHSRCANSHGHILA